MNFPSSFEDMKSDVFHDCAQNISAQMGLGDELDFRRSPKFYKSFQHAVGVAGVVISSGKEFAVGKRSGPTFTKLDIRFGIQSAFFDELLNIGSALINLFPSFKNDWLDSSFKALQGRKHSRRTKTDDDRSFQFTGSMRNGVFGFCVFSQFQVIRKISVHQNCQ